MRKRAPRMRKLTMILLRWSTGAIEVRNRLAVADSGEVLREETMKFRRLKPPLLDSTLLDDLIDEVLVLRYTAASGRVSNNGHERSSGEVCW
jgi:hypothetical protein